MKRVIEIAAPALFPIADGGEELRAVVTVQLVVLSGAPTFSANFRTRVIPPRRVLSEVANAITPALDTSAPFLAYRDTAAAAETAGATAITAVGIFEVNVTNMDVGLHVSALSGGTLALVVGNVVAR
jgi:hypothetical protein